jgi:hypothetical protein
MREVACAVEDDPRRCVHAVARHGCGEVLSRRHREPQPGGVVRKFALDIEKSRARNMSGIIVRPAADDQIRQIAPWLRRLQVGRAIEDAQGRVSKMSRKPFGLHQRFGFAVLNIFVRHLGLLNGVLFNSSYFQHLLIHLNAC